MSNMQKKRAFNWLKIKDTCHQEKNFVIVRYKILTNVSKTKIVFTLDKLRYTDKTKS